MASSDSKSKPEHVDTVTIESPNRPLTRGARAALQEYGIEEERHPREYGKQSVVEVSERPPDSLLEEHELQIKEAPLEIWETDYQQVLIFPSQVVGEDDGPINLSPEEAAAEARKQDRFSPVDVPDDSPIAPDA